MPEIVIRPAIGSDIPALLALEHFYETSHVWQMDRQVEDGVVSVGFREVRLPRKVKVETPTVPQWLEDNWKSQPGFLAAIVRAEAAREARILSLIAVGTRGDVRQLDRTLDRLNDLTRPHAPLRSTR